MTYNTGEPDESPIAPPIEVSEGMLARAILQTTGFLVLILFIAIGLGVTEQKSLVGWVGFALCVKFLLQYKLFCAVTSMSNYMRHYMAFLGAFSALGVLLFDEALALPLVILCTVLALIAVRCFGIPGGRGRMVLMLAIQSFGTYVLFLLPEKF